MGWFLFNSALGNLLAGLFAIHLVQLGINKIKGGK